MGIIKLCSAMNLKDIAVHNITFICLRIEKSNVKLLYFTV